MVLHAAWLMQLGQRWAAGDPLIVAGDFNVSAHQLCHFSAFRCVSTVLNAECVVFSLPFADERCVAIRSNQRTQPTSSSPTAPYRSATRSIRPALLLAATPAGSRCASSHPRTQRRQRLTLSVKMPG